MQLLLFMGTSQVAFSFCVSLQPPDGLVVLRSPYRFLNFKNEIVVCLPLATL
jgi:hypothetical protein